MLNWTAQILKKARFSSILLVVAVAASPASAKEKAYEHYVFGNINSATPQSVSGGLLMMGGGDRNKDALTWFFNKAGKGHIVVLSASYGKEIGEEFFNEVGGVQSVEIFVMHNRNQSTNRKILKSIKNADGIFVAGGDQARYIRYWRDTPIASAINAHIAAGKPFAGTSAGLAIQGEKIYGAMDDGSITTEDALRDPFGPSNTIEDALINLPPLTTVLTDSHFTERNRLGRLFAFVAKAQSQRPADAAPIKGLGIDESAALAVEPDGTGRIYSTSPTGYAWLVEGAGLRIAPQRGPLDAPRVKVTGIGAGSVVQLPSGKVDAPVFTRNYAVRAGEIAEVPRWSLAIHGGAGVIERGDLTPDKERAYRAGLDAALQAGAAVLDQGGSALDATAAAVRVLEDDILFNAGRGSVFTAEGVNELDAAIMDGKTQKAGAVAGVTHTRNPIDLARAVMEKTRHVMLTGAGANRFSKEQNLPQVDPKWFFSDERWQQLQAWKAKNSAAIDRTHLFGTVGAVALDAAGNLAAATSTGGMTGKRWGRVGDSPIIGAGTYAKNGQCAVSATGSGEFFIRESAARQVCDRVAWKGESLKDAAQATIMAVGAIGGDGGLIAMGPDGRPAFAINDLGMYRGGISADTPARTAIYANETLDD